MADINKNLKSICSFYASEWHLVTMLLPNLDQKINKGVKVTTILEKDLTKEMETLLTKLHLEDKKEIIKEKHTTRVPMFLMSSAFPLGRCIEFIESIDDVPQKEMAYAEYYYFSGRHEKAVWNLEKTDARFQSR